MSERQELLSYTLKVLGPVDEAVELGVAAGEHAALIHQILNPKRFYLIDAWGLDEAYRELTGEGPAKYYPALEKTRQMFEGRSGVQIIQGKTTTEHVKFGDHKFDFIYIDADHRYESMKKDIENWFPKLRVGGIIAGHDYCDDLKPVFGVIKAVTEFRENNKDKIKNFKIFGTGMNRCWLIETKT